MSRSIDITRALAIPGWMSEEELTWLATQAQTHKRIVEIGSWRGRSTAAFADNVKAGGTVLSVDTWLGSQEHAGELKDKPKDWLLHEWLRNAGAALHVAPMRGKSLDVAKHLTPSQFDMVFLDGAHDYDSVKADIIAWKPLLVDGGLLCGHDYYGDFPGVKQAVDELVPNVKIAVGSIWYEPL